MISIIVHGGAKELKPEEEAPHRDGCLIAAEVGYEMLASGGSAEDAVEAAIRVLEDDPVFNAGYGSELNAEGEVQMDAAIMHGGKFELGGVAFVQGVRHPITLARKMLYEKEILITGDGARKFAVEKGAELCDPADLITPEARKKFEEESAAASNNTVGAVALDVNGNIASGASTGGIGRSRRGRVGDSPQSGCGLFADNLIGGTAFTGDGELIARLVLAKSTIDHLAKTTCPESAAKASVERLERTLQGEGGCIVLSSEGSVGWYHNSSHMAVAFRSEGMTDTRAFIKKVEEASLV